MDYNRTTMSETPDARARRRLTLTVIILATLPCYCIGWIAMTLAPDKIQLTPTVTQTDISGTTATGTLSIQTPTISLTPLIVTGTITNTATFTPTATPTMTNTLSPTPFQPATGTYTSTYTPSPTITPSFTFTPSPTNSFTPTASFTPQSVTPSITSFPTTSQ